MESASVQSLSSAPVSSSGASIDEKVEAEMTRLLYRSAGFGLFSNFALGGILVAGTSAVHSLALHATWLGTLLAVSLLRLGMNIAFARAKPPIEDHWKWRRAFVAGVAVAGLIWGAAGWFYFETNEFLPRMLLVCILVGMNAGAARSLASVPWSYRIYVIATITPVLARFALLPDAGAWAFVMVTITYALFLLNTASLHHTDLRHLWRLIFENRELVETMSEAKERAEAASLSKSDFLATMSHEIRTPMNGILGMLQVLHESPLNAEQQKQVEIASSSADTLMRLLNDILDFSKIESGKLEFESIPFSLAPVISEVAALLRPRAEEKNLSLALSLPPDLPAYVVGDAMRLKQVLLNLTGNAIKFTVQGGVEIIVAVRARDARSVSLRFAVRDTGIGMDDATQAKLFRVFSQGDSSMSRRFGGTGLGLAISQRLVTHMGGRISVESETGLGSEFSFEATFPLGTAPATEIPAPSPGRRQLKARLLVVEDDRVNQRVIELLLRKIGIEAVITSDGSSAVEISSRENFDAILMDCQMPGMDGFEATRLIRERLNGRHLPIIAITANALAGDREACTAAGMDDFIAKPIRQDELRACLERWLK